MPKITLSITADYCDSWKYFQGIRELIQNAKDSEEFDGNEMVIEHFPRTDRLTITSKGVVVEPSSLLLLGKSSKKAGNQRGKFGEGFVLGVLALVRDGFKITIHNGDEVWRPEIVPAEPGSAFEGNDLLTFNTRKLQAIVEDFTITIEKVSKEVWAETRKLFLFLEPPKASETAKVDTDTVLFNEEYRGMIFSRGIFVCRHDDLECGYDLSNLKLDRDRNAVDMWDLKWTLADVWKRAHAAEPEKNAPRVYRMVKENKVEIKSLTHHADEKLIKALRDEFEKEHGVDTVPVTTMSDSRELERLGAKTAMVNTTLRDLLDKTGTQVAKTRAALQSAVKETYTWADLTLLERDACTSWVDKVTTDYTIVAFNDDLVQCRVLTEDNRLAIAKWLLTTPPRDILRAIVTHEAARRKVPVEEVWLDALGLGASPSMPAASPTETTVSVDLSS